MILLDQIDGFASHSSLVDCRVIPLQICDCNHAVVEICDCDRAVVLVYLVIYTR